MPRKKKSSELPPLTGPSPPGSARFGTRTVRSAGTPGEGQRRVFWDTELFKAGSGDAPTQSEPSTAASLGISRDDARSISQMLDDSLNVTSGSIGFTTAPDTADSTQGWDIQSPEDIIQEVVQCVHDRKPWRQKLDDSLLEQKHNERQDRLERGFHIILPDNRVRVFEDELSYRVRCSLLASGPEEEQPPPPRRPDKSKTKNAIRMRQNPWYKKPTSWYSVEEKLRAESNEEDRNDFPYAQVILSLKDEAKADQPSSAAALTPFQKENLEMYKQYMKGQRLPHFLQ